MASITARIKTLSGRFSKGAWAFLISILITGIVNAAWLLFFNIYILARGIDKDVLGLLNAAPSISGLVFGIPLGLLADRMGKRRAMIVGLVFAVVGWTLEVTLTQPALIFAAAVLAGAGSTLWFISQAPFMMEISDEDNRTLLFSLNYGMSTLAGALGNLLAGQLPQTVGQALNISPDSATAYQVVLIASLVITTAGILPLLFIRESGQPSTNIETARRLDLKELFRRPLTLRLVIPNLLLGCGAALIVGYFNVFYVEHWSLSDQRLGVLFSALSLVTGIGTLIGPRLEARVGGKILAIITLQVVAIFCVLGLGFSPVLWISEICLLGRGTAMMTAGALYSAFSMEKTSPEARGAVNSLMFLTFQIGWAVGPYVSGLVQQQVGFTPLFIATSIFYASATLAMWMFFGKSKQTT